MTYKRDDAAKKRTKASTAPSEMLANGVAPTVVQKQMRH
jgi:hypothetical protein